MTRLAGAQAGKAGSGRGGHHEEEILGKAYDGRLMRRLLRYLIPYERGSYYPELYQKQLLEEELERA